MLEILNHPAFYPALLGFLGGLVFTWFVFSIRLRFVRSAAKAAEKATSGKVATLVSEKSALETEIAALRSTEARIMKHQGELESRAKSDEARSKEFAGLLEKMNEQLEAAFASRERTLLAAIDKIEAAPPLPSVTKPAEPSSAVAEDLDFVPLENLPDAGEEKKKEISADFVGFDVEETAAKAESAANAFREALKKKDQ